MLRKRKWVLGLAAVLALGMSAPAVASGKHHRDQGEHDGRGSDSDNDSDKDSDSDSGKRKRPSVREMIEKVYAVACKSEQKEAEERFRALARIVDAVKNKEESAQDEIRREVPMEKAASEVGSTPAVTEEQLATTTLDAVQREALAAKQEAGRSAAKNATIVERRESSEFVFPDVCKDFAQFMVEIEGVRVVGRTPDTIRAGSRLAGALQGQLTSLVNTGLVPPSAAEELLARAAKIQKQLHEAEALALMGESREAIRATVAASLAYPELESKTCGILREALGELVDGLK